MDIRLKNRTISLRQSHQQAQNRLTGGLMLIGVWNRLSYEASADDLDEGPGRVS